MHKIVLLRSVERRYGFLIEKYNYPILIGIDVLVTKGRFCNNVKDTDFCDDSPSFVDAPDIPDYIA